MVIPLVPIGGYFISDYSIGGYFISDYSIGGYSIKAAQPANQRHFAHKH